MLDAVNLAAKLALFAERWSPKSVAGFNGNDVMVVKLEGAFPWHVHPETDDFFLVLDGHVRIETEHGDAELGPGELCVVPRGVEHRPRGGCLLPRVAEGGDVVQGALQVRDTFLLNDPDVGAAAEAVRIRTAVAVGGALGSCGTRCWYSRGGR